jgi:hypothetical protein
VIEDYLLNDKNFNVSEGAEGGCYYLKEIDNENNVYKNIVYGNYDENGRCVRKEHCPSNFPGVYYSINFFYMFAFIFF